MQQEDAVDCITQLYSKHLEKPSVYALVFFADFSSEFDTVCPVLLAKKMSEMNVDLFIFRWFHSMLTNRSQQVKINSVLSSPKLYSFGVPQGGEFTFPLYSLHK